MEKKQNKKVFVGLSGGVDSSVSAALLKQAGYEVTGVFIKTWHPDFLPCTWKEDRLDAMRVAAHLDIPFLTFDFEREYKEGVADYMLGEYKLGRTPNPDVMCNKEIKFGAFLTKAKEMGADFIATGHYAQNIEKNGRFHLFAGNDKGKDQSYFLWTLDQEQLSHILFPVGHLQKSEVRILAEHFSLPTAQRKDSQGICFLGALDMREFLAHYIEPKKGNVLDTEGKVIGTHEGAVFSTFGQRHGFTVYKKSIGEKPYYIVGKDLSQNTLTVSHQKVQNLSTEKKEMILEQVHFIADIPGETDIYKARFHYRQPLEDVKVKSISEEGQVKIVFRDPVEPWAPGQSLVLYDREECLGGGIIR